MNRFGRLRRKKLVLPREGIVEAARKAFDGLCVGGCVYEGGMEEEE